MLQETFVVLCAATTKMECLSALEDCHGQCPGGLSADVSLWGENNLNTCLRTEMIV